MSGKIKGGCFATFIERKTRLYSAIKMPDPTANSMELAIKQVYNSLPNPSDTDSKLNTVKASREIDTPHVVSQAKLEQMFNWNPYESFITATTDRGGEFACFERIEKDLSVKLYFADPYCSHQRGSNEYGNGLLREFYPKGTNLANVGESELNHSLSLINNRPRKCLGWISAVQAFADEVSQLG